MSLVSSLRGAGHTLSVTGPALPMFLGQPALEPVRLSGREGINSLFEYELTLKTPDALNLLASGAADWDLNSFLGREICCVIELDGSGEFVPGVVGPSVDRIGAGTRQINAMVTLASRWGEEGRHVQYTLTLSPWLHRATLSVDCKVFQNKTVVELLDELLADYPFPVEKRLIESYPVRDFQVQLNETDYDFFLRLTQAHGISFWFSHSEGKHRLVLIDNMGAYQKSDSEAYQQVDYHPPGWKTDAEYIHSFVPHSRLTSGQYSTRDYDYTRPRADLSVSRSDPRPTSQATAEVYQWHAGQGGSHYAQPRAGTAGANDPHAEGRDFALLRMQALRTHGHRARASGNLRAMVPGYSFSLQKHPSQAANREYLILDTQLLIEDVARDSQIKEASPRRKQQWKVEVDFTAHPMAEMLRPALTQTKPYNAGAQTALVVGPEGENLWTDQYGRIKVQFLWDRTGLKTQHSSCWLRVSSQWAGNQLGAMHLPRMGQEVLVTFLNGDPNLPICSGQVYNQNKLTPWALPGQAALSGFRSRELTKDGGNSAAGRSNHLILDDTDQKIQAQLKSDHQSSSLSLGHITRIEDHAGRKDPRGEGFELRSDGHGALRASAGLLLTTEARPKAQAHTTDMAETVARLSQGRDLQGALGSAAQEARAQEAGDQGEVAKALKAQNDAIEGTGKPGHFEAGRFPELDEPHLVLASAAGIESSSAQSTHLQAGEHIALSSAAHASISAGASFLASAKQAIRFFAYKAGIRLFAFGGDIDIKALKQNIHLFAKLRIMQVANKITISAEDELVLNGGGSYIRLNAGGHESGTAGAYRAHAAGYHWNGPKNAPTVPWSAVSSLKEQAVTARSFVLRSHAPDGRLITTEPYTLYRDGVEVSKGVTDAQGRVLIADHQQGTGSYKIRLTNGNEFELPVTSRLQGTDQTLAAQGYRAAQNKPNDRQQHYQHRQGGPNET